jgi:threonine/homoserine/homoserine lactone efflux protein
MRKFVRFLFVLFAIGMAYMIWFVISLFRAPDMSKVPAYYPFKSEKKMELYLNY